MNVYPRWCAVQRRLLANFMLRKASLQQANLSNACLLGTDFSDANLHTASVSGANLSFVKVELKAIRPDQRESKVLCEPTKIETKAADSDTTCPSARAARAKALPGYAPAVR